MKSWNIRNKNLSKLYNFTKELGLFVTILAPNTHMSKDDADDHAFDADWSSVSDNVDFSVVTVKTASGTSISGKQFHKIIVQINNL